MDIGLVLNLREIARTDALARSTIYDPLWWLYSVSKSKYTDEFLNDNVPGRGASLLGELTIQPKYLREYLTYLDEEDQQQNDDEEYNSTERFMKIIEYYRSDGDVKYIDGDYVFASLLQRWQPVNQQQQRRVVHGKYAKQLRTSLHGIPLTNEVVLFGHDGKQAENAANWPLMEIPGIGSFRVSPSIHERYADCLMIFDTKKYTLMRHPSGRGVLVAYANEYNVRNFFYSDVHAGTMAQPKIYTIDTTTVYHAGEYNDKTNLVFISFETFTNTFRNVYAVSADDKRERLVNKARKAIAAFDADLTHGSITLDNILVVDNDDEKERILFINGGQTKQRKESKNAPTFSAYSWQPSGYAQFWDRLTFSLDVLTSFYDETKDQEFEFALELGSIYIPQIKVDAEKKQVTTTYVAHDSSGLSSMEYQIVVAIANDRAHRTRSIVIAPTESNTVTLHHLSQDWVVEITQLKAMHVSLGGYLARGSYGSTYSLEKQAGAAQDYALIAKLGNIDIGEYDTQVQVAEYGVCPRILKSLSLPVVSKGGRKVTETLSAIVMEAMDITMENHLQASTTTTDMIIVAVRSFYEKLAIFAAARFIHHDLKLDNVMLKRGEDGQMIAYIIDFGKTWRADVDDDGLSYGKVRLPNSQFTSIDSAHFAVGWLEIRPRNVSNIYDMIASFHRLCICLATIRNDELRTGPLVRAIPAVATFLREEVLKRYIMRTRDVDDTTDATGMITDDFNHEIIYTEYPRLSTEFAIVYRFTNNGVELQQPSGAYEFIFRANNTFANAVQLFPKPMLFPSLPFDAGVGGFTAGPFMNALGSNAFVMPFASTPKAVADDADIQSLPTPLAPLAVAELSDYQRELRALINNDGYDDEFSWQQILDAISPVRQVPALDDDFIIIS